MRGDLHRARNELAAAAVAYNRAIELGPDLREPVISLAAINHLSGDTETAIAALENLVSDPETLPVYRIDGVFALGALLSARGEFDRYIAALHALRPQFEAAEIFLPKALAEEAIARLRQSGDLTAARRSAADAVAEAARIPGAATRYQLALALCDLAAGNHPAVLALADTVRAAALPADDPDRTEDKVADFLAGRIALGEQRLDTAIAHLERASRAGGHAYFLYERWWAGALAADNRIEQAMAVLDALLAPPQASQPRLDLEFDRAMARLELAELQASRDPAAARALAEPLVALWQNADPGFPGVERVTALLTGL